MPDTSDLELDFVEKATRDYFLPRLPDDWKGYEHLKGEDLEVARSVLAQAYVEHANLKQLWKPLILIGVYDILFHLQPIIYGLVLSAIGSVSLAIPAMHTPRSLAGDTLRDSKEMYENVRNRPKNR